MFFVDLCYIILTIQYWLFRYDVSVPEKNNYSNEESGYPIISFVNAESDPRNSRQSILDELVSKSNLDKLAILKEPLSNHYNIGSLIEKG